MIKISAIITSGGASIRFGSNKLLEKIGNLSVIETTILKFIDLVDEIIIPSTTEIKNYLLNSNLDLSKIKFVQNGASRQKSVFNGLMTCSNPKIVLIHDGARPFVKKEEIKEVIDKTLEKNAVVLGYKAIDTIKEIDEQGKIIKTLDRKNIFLAQTPQGFNFELIKKIHLRYKNIEGFTDDSSMAEDYGIDVFCVFGSKNNKKITTKEDLSN